MAINEELLDQLIAGYQKLYGIGWVGCMMGGNLRPDRGKNLSIYIRQIHTANSWVMVDRGTKSGRKQTATH